VGKAKRAHHRVRVGMALRAFAHPTGVGSAKLVPARRLVAGS
jgi:hypothetical protein